MITKTVDLEASPISVDALLTLLQNDTEFVLMKGAVAVARLMPIEAATQPLKPNVAGSHRGTTWVNDDSDDPLPDEFWLGNLMDVAL